MDRVRESAKERISDTFSGSYDPDDGFFVDKKQKKKDKKIKKKRGKRFSETEKKDLASSSVLVILVGIALLAPSGGIIQGFLNFITYIQSDFWLFPLIMISIFWGTYMIHEMAHKFTAQFYGMWSEFRMTRQGWYLSIIAILFSIPIFGTGVVYTSGAKSMEEDGKVNLAGPFSNFIVAAILTVIAIYIPLMAPLTGLSAIFIIFALQYGIIINAMIGLFNMIPFQPFDGGTIREWDLRIWIIQTIALVALAIFGYLIMPIIY
ncbi:MAG: site-2 protease family protein [Candidatus Thorarchaeota archaeon]